MSTAYFGFLQGAYFEGQEAGQTVAACLTNPGQCSSYERYEVLYGSTQPSAYNETNGWMVSSFQTWGLQDS